MADLQTWAAARAPELLARAEAEAVARLRDALVAAAVAPVDKVDPQPEPLPPRQPDKAQGELIWAYCVLPAEARAPRVAGVDPRFPVERVAAGRLSALVSRVPRAEFGPEALRENLNDLAWLERVARAHEAVLEHALSETALVPLRLCTLYENSQGVRRMLEKERVVLQTGLESVTGRQEWGVKLLVDREGLLNHARASSSEASSMAAELDGASEAAAYMMGRRLERHVREVADALAGEVSIDLRSRLESAGFEFVTRPPQNRDLSQHEGEMLVNAACLVDDGELQRLRELAADVETTHAALGARVELTGPWPPYNFVLGADAATLA